MGRRDREGGWGEERELTFDDKCNCGSGGLWPANGDGDDDERLDVLLSSSLLLLPSNLQFRCMKNLVFLAIYKIFLYPLGVQKFSVLFWSGIFSA